MPGASESGSDLPCRNRSCRAGARGAASRSRRSRSLQNARRFEKLFEARAGFRRSVERGDKGVILLGAQREFAAVRERFGGGRKPLVKNRSEEHTSELQSRVDLVCRLLLEKKKKKQK